MAAYKSDPAPTRSSQGTVSKPTGRGPVRLFRPVKYATPTRVKA